MSSKVQEPPQRNVRYVALSGQPTGWAAMAETVRKFDEEKIDDCKDDIDTLLVFAGLFSAVLTAFLLESYQMLQEDTAVVTLRVLQQIASQTSSYTFYAGMLNSTAAPLPLPPPFRPSTAAIRVNVLWFASLIVSLVAASLGMLVKQWLREYLTADYPSPQARLRVRHLRRPALDKWRVIEIGAALPLLLQTALALFFTGLCYFTAEIHATIGHTTLPLVAAWALFYIAATALPIFLPRCPYKTTLLKVGVQSAFRHITVSATSRSSRLQNFGSSRASRFYSSCMHWLARYTSAADEKEVAGSDTMDLDILASVDAIQSNDELLATTIREALEQGQPHWTKVINFVLQVLEHRLQQDGLVRDRDYDWSALDLRLLTRRSREAINGILVHHLREANIEGQTTEPELEQRAVLAAFSILTWSVPEQPLQLSDNAKWVVTRCLFFHGKHICKTLVDYCLRSPSALSQSALDLDKVKMIRLLGRLVSLLDIVEPDLDHAIEWLEGVIDSGFRDPQKSADPFKCHSPVWIDWLSNVDDPVRLRVTEYLIKSVKLSISKAGPTNPIPRRVFDIFSFSFLTNSHVIYEVSTPMVHDLQAIIFALLSTKERIVPFLEMLLYANFEQVINPLIRYSVLGTLMERQDAWTSAFDSLADILGTAAPSVSGRLRIGSASHGALPSRINTTQALRLCYLVVWLVKRRHVSHSDQSDQACRRLLAAAAGLIARSQYHPDKVQQRHLAELCLYRIHSEETEMSVHDDKFEEWHNAFDMQAFHFDNTLVKVLAEIHHEADKYWPVRRFRPPYGHPPAPTSASTVKFIRLQSHPAEIRFYEHFLWTRHYKPLLPFVLQYDGVASRDERLEAQYGYVSDKYDIQLEDILHHFSKPAVLAIPLDFANHDNASFVAQSPLPKICWAHSAFDRPVSGASFQELLSSRTRAEVPLEDIMSNFFGIPRAPDTADDMRSTNEGLLGISLESLSNISKLMVKELDSVKRALEDIPSVIGATLLLAYETIDELESVSSPKRLRPESQAWSQPLPQPRHDDQIRHDQAKRKDVQQSRLIYAVRLLNFKLADDMGAEGEESTNLSELESVREALRRAIPPPKSADGAWGPVSGSTSPQAVTPR